MDSEGGRAQEEGKRGREGRREIDGRGSQEEGGWVGGWGEGGREGRRPWEGGMRVTRLGEGRRAKSVRSRSVGALFIRPADHPAISVCLSVSLCFYLWNTNRNLPLK